MRSLDVHARSHRRIALAGILSALLIGMVLHTAMPASANANGAVPHYLMTAFTNSSESNMYVYDSPNGTNYALQRANAYTPPSGLIRDPSVMRHSDGYYWVVYTTNWSGNTIGLARSADYLTWSFVRNVTVNVSGITNAWAPEWFKDSDGSINVIVSVSKTGISGQFQPYRLTATNSALSSWSTPTTLNGLGANHIDSFIVKVGSTYHDFTKNETTKYIEHATAPSLGGPWTFVGTGNWAGWGSGLEGPALLQLPNGSWRIYFDQYGAGRYYYADSTNLANWGGKVELPGLSGTVRHFTVLRESVGDSVATPTGARSLRSSNYPDRYVRHRNYLGYVDPLSAASSAADRSDATFTIVAGLANAGCYSFRTANGQYLRHYGYRINLATDDGSGVFRGDATFCSRKGLAGGSTTSFESYNHPGRYLRHSNFELWVDQFDSSTAFAGDASFTVTSPLG